MDSEPDYQFIDAKCSECGKDFKRRVFSVLGKTIGGVGICEECRVKFAAEEEAKANRATQRREDEKWEAVCPLIYRDTDLRDARLASAAVSAVARWSPGVRGLGLIGTTGRGKTRCLYMALRKAHGAKMTVAALSHTKLSRIAMDAFSGDKDERRGAREILSELHRADVILLDDLGKPPSTERADSELEELVEDRTSEGKPILWTANGSGEWLIKRFGVDRGEPLVRRLAEFSDVTTL